MTVSRLGRRSAAALLTGAVLAAAAPGILRAQDTLPPLSVEVRLGDFGLESADRVRRGRISLAHAPGGATLRVHFLRDRAEVAPEPPPASLVLPTVPDAAPGGEGLPRPEALWVWNTRELLRDDGARRDFLAFVQGHGFRRVFLQLPPAEGERAAAGFVPFDGGALGPLVAALEGLGVGTWALDGDPAYALAANHAGVLATVDRVAAHNAAAPPEQRVQGVRYDVEPYLTPGFQGPRRAEILDGYVALVAAVGARARAAGLSAGVDIPFWLDAPDEDSGRPLDAVLDGVRRPVLEHVLAHVDEVAVMDYRTTASGPDGSVAHAVAELEAAGRAGAGVLVAVETEALVDEDLFTFAGEGWEGPPPEPGRWVVLEPAGADRARVWLVEGSGARGALLSAVAEAGLAPASLRHWPAGRAARVAADKQSFHRLGGPRLLAESGRLVAALASYPAFRGLAYHHYGSLKELLERR
ncbi:MAG: hypothetical protein Q8N53_11545 [Longimicrobiales bacterium]|nr:hypothetical protein [Longimicrobiales bacterium]